MSEYNIIIPTNMKPRPRPHESSAAMILATYFCCDIYFISSRDTSSPDILANNIEWEIKSPTGNSKDTIKRNLREAGHQSRNVVIDLRRCKLRQTRALGYIKQYLKGPHTLKHVLVITKSENVVEFL